MWIPHCNTYWTWFFAFCPETQEPNLYSVACALVSDSSSKYTHVTFGCKFCINHLTQKWIQKNTSRRKHATTIHTFLPSTYYPRKKLQEIAKSFRDSSGYRWKCDPFFLWFVSFPKLAKTIKLGSSRSHPINYYLWRESKLLVKALLLFNQVRSLFPW